MRALGIDFGEARIGLALCDDAGRVVTPRGVVERDTDRRAVAQIRDLVEAEDVQVLVLGEPKGLDGVADERTERVLRFGAKLQRATRLPLVRVDEALTTVAAAERLREAGMDDERGAPERRDAVAAQILLEEALERGLVEGASEGAST